MSRRGLSSDKAYWSKPKPLTPQASDEQYARWRKTIPYTNDQIADALLKAADDAASKWVADGYRFLSDRVRKTGHFSGRVVGIAMAYLVTQCALCEKKALYRFGREGRCRAHRLITPEFYRAKQQRNDDLAVEIERSHKSFDYEQLRRERLRR